MVGVNIASCELEDGVDRGAFWHRESSLGERLGAKWIGASVYEAQEGRPIWPYHYHHGVEEWMYVLSGTPILRDRGGEQPLSTGDLVAFASGELGAHTMRGPGRFLIFSVGALGWGEAFVTEYPDSDQIAAAPGVRFRRDDAIDSWDERGDQTSELLNAAPTPAPGNATPVVNLSSIPEQLGTGLGTPELGSQLGARTWAVTLRDLAAGDAPEPYHYSWCREEWALVLGGTPTLRHPDGEDVLDPGALVCFTEGPAGAHRFQNHGDTTARLITFSTPIGRPSSTFYPDDETVVIHIPAYGGYRFSLDDQVDDYWDGEPGAAIRGSRC
ncbi:MAG: cupin domain-containing protein [Solirubrobacteraceae bacterium]